MTGDPHIDARLSAWKRGEGEPDPQRLHEKTLEERTATSTPWRALGARIRSLIRRRG